MLGLISKALASGYTQKQILDFIMKKFPEHAEKIKTAVSMGFSPNSVLHQISSGRKDLKKHSGYITEHEETRKNEKQKEKNLENIALTTAGTALAAPLAGYALSRAAPQLGSLAESLFNKSNNTQSQQIVPQSIQNPPPISSIPNEQASINPEPIQEQKVDIQPIISQYPNILNKIKSLKASGNDPQAISAYFQKFQPKDIKQIEKETKMPFDSIVQEVVGKEPEPIQESQKEQTLQYQRTSKIEPINTPIQHNETIGNLALMPNGEIGEIQSEKNGIAKIRTDNGENHRKINELTFSPLSKPDLATLHSDLLRGIETSTGKEVSRHVNWIGYDPHANELAYKPWNGEEYVFDNIPKEDVDRLTSFLSQRKTSGENFVGAYEAGTNSPVGHEMFKLLQKLKARAKDQGKPKAHIRKFETVYSAYEPAEKEAKEKKKKKEKEMKEREKRKKTKK